MPADAENAVAVIATADGSRTLYSQRYAQAYRSRQGALSEAVSVFAKGSAAADRLAAGMPTRVLEVGFGTGLNFLVTANAAGGALRPLLTYVAVERELPPSQALAELDYSALLAPSPLPAELLTWCRRLEAEGCRADLHELGPSAQPNGRLTLFLGEARDLELA